MKKNKLPDRFQTTQEQVDDCQRDRQRVPGDGVAQVVVGRKNWSTNVAGVVPDYLAARDWSLSRGEPFDLRAVESTAKVAILGQTVVRRLFGETDPLGRMVRIESVPFLVVGVLHGKGHSASGRDEDDRVFIPITTAKRRLIGERYQVNRSAVDFILVKSSTAQATALVTEEVGKLLRQRHRLRPDQPDDFIVRDLSAIKSIQEESSRALALLLGFVASVSLVVSGFGVMNTMLASIAERTREIGLRLALGAKPRDLSRQFLTEAAVHFLIGGLAGLPVGALAAAAIAEFAGWPVMLTAESFALAIAFSAGLGLVFGAYPARKAAGLSPIEALRWE